MLRENDQQKHRRDGSLVVIGVRLIGEDRVRASLTLPIQRLAQLQAPLLRAAIITRDAAVRRIKMGGDPPWPPAKYPQDHRLGVDTGVMWRSIGISTLTPNAMRIGTNVKYARYFQEGTGTYAGHSPWVQVASGSAIAFSIGGTMFFRRSVNHRGQPPRPFLYFDEKDRIAISRVFLLWIRGELAA